MPIQRINPDNLPKNPAFSQTITTSGPGKTIYIGGQNSITVEKEIIGKGDIKAQTEQALKNVEACLKACGAGFEHVVQMTVYVVQGQSVQDGFAAAQKFDGLVANPPTISVVFVAGLGNPDFLVEISAVAFIAD
jgi:enamine deaminase RidA (YjgF/YER057c/UK114 family)